MKDPNYQKLTSSACDPSLFPGKTMVEVFEKNSALYPEKVIYYFLENGLDETSRITYGEMNRRVKAIAARLQQDFSKGDRALMLFPPGIEFIVSLFGCFYAGIIAVPAYPPRKNRMFNRFESIVTDCSPAVILTTKKIHEDILKNFAGEECLQGIQYIDYEEIDDEASKSWSNPHLKSEDLALLQYTSGSTGRPGGVMVSHANILVNSEFIRQAYGHTDKLMGVNWLPGFHDMGLIGALIQPAYVGGSNAIIPPNSFLLKPVNWLKSISAYQSNTAGGPNFAFQFCADRMNADELEGIDLSSVRPFFCGAEPIRKETLDAFARAFEPYRFKRDQFYPCYGLAESVLIVTGGGLFDEPVYLVVDAKELEKGRIAVAVPGHPNARTLVGCGYPWLGTSVAIVDPSAGKCLPAGKIGEIWVSGPSVTQGYWNKPVMTQETFGACLAETGQGPFLRTGDLGFIHEGQLYITGRIKDLIIIRGMNHYPTDLERTVENAHEALQPAAGAAFSIEAGNEERLVLVQEIRRTHLRELQSEEVFEAIRLAIAENHQLQVYAITLIRTGSIPKTSSGKIQRFKAKLEFLNNELDIIAQWQMENPESYALSPVPPVPAQTGISSIPDDDIVQWIRAWMSKELAIDINSIESDKPIAAYGLDSLKAVLLASDASKHFGIEWPLDLFLEETTIEEIVRKGKELK
jgi:myxalamid-type polyketide synthase MxaB